MDITFDRKTVGSCLQQHFTLPSYQREYKWELKHLRELMTDIQDAFLECYRPNHGRLDVGSYSPYFLGTIITTNAEGGSRSIIDGQQRLTTLLMIMAYFARLRQQDPTKGISNIEPMLHRQVFGQQRFNIDFDHDRTALFSILIDVGSNKDVADLQNRVDAIVGLSESSQKI